MPTDFGNNPNVDLSVWDVTQNIRQGVSMALNGNEFSECVHGVVPVTNSTISYEKSLRETQIITHDPSGGGIDRDACGDDARGKIAAGNMTGRVWGAYSDAVVEPGADGLAIGKETGIENHGSDQPLLDQHNSKYGHLLTSKGNQPATAAVYATAGNYHHGLVMRNDSLTDDGALIVLYKAGTNEPIFRVNSQGMLTHCNGRSVAVRRVNGVDVLALG